MADKEKDEQLKRDNEIKDFCQSRAIAKAEKVAKFLESVALDDNYQDVRAVRIKDPNTGEYIYTDARVSVPVNVRVTAAKTWKEMIMDKAVGDVKEKAKERKNEALDMKKASAAIEKAMRKPLDGDDDLDEEPI